MAIVRLTLSFFDACLFTIIANEFDLHLSRGRLLLLGGTSRLNRDISGGAANDFNWTARFEILLES